MTLAKLTKVIIETLPLIEKDSACAFGEVVLNIEELI
jgi:hypothetical protein